MALVAVANVAEYPDRDPLADIDIAAIVEPRWATHKQYEFFVS